MSNFINTHTNNLKEIRNHFVAILEEHTLKQLLEIPDGFRNNIFWNAAHVVVTQQLLQYYLTDNKLLVDNKWVELYKKGTFGNEDATADDVDDLIELLLKTPAQLKKDYENDKLNFYKAYETSFGINLNSIEDAIVFNNIHEGIHLGYAMAIRKLV